tara:strand:+ start:284 stop:484 length:201 start_codon:yes stop_codon:yes gene_type:complete
MKIKTNQGNISKAPIKCETVLTSSGYRDLRLRPDQNQGPCNMELRRAFEFSGQEGMNDLPVKAPTL